MNLKCKQGKRCGPKGAFTLMELVTVIAIISILILLLTPAIGRVRALAQKSSCSHNLTSLYVAANLYTQEQGHWPQVDVKTYGKPAFAKSWVDALSPYGIHEINWICPTIQTDLKNPDIHRPGQMRLDYIGTPFGPDPRAPYKFATQPWFVERGDVHGDGNLVIFANGNLQTLAEIRKNTQMQIAQ